MNLNTLLECMNLTTSFCASGRQWGFHLNQMSLRCESLVFCTIKPSFLLVFRFFSNFQTPSPNAAAQVVATPVPLGPIFLDCHVPMFPLCFVWFRHIPPKFPMVIYYVSHFDPQVLNILHMYVFPSSTTFYPTSFAPKF